MAHLKGQLSKNGRNNMAIAKARKSRNKILRQEQDEKEAAKLGIHVNQLLTRRAQEGNKIIQAAKEEERLTLKRAEEKTKGSYSTTSSRGRGLSTSSSIYDLYGL